MSRCKLCGGSFKNNTKEHVLKTRNKNNPERIIENLDVLECTICGNVVIPDTSEKINNFFRVKARREMAENGSYVESASIFENIHTDQELSQELSIEQNRFAQIKDMLKKLID